MMNIKTYGYVTTVIFILVALIHLTRALLDWDFVVAGWIMPTWFSWIGFAVATYVAYCGYSLINKK